MIPFTKMHGLGNDFVIIDERVSPMQIAPEGQRAEAVRAIASRRTGVGCDQLIVLRPTQRADAYMQIYNADGSEAGACGNAARCVAWLMLREGRKDASLIETVSGLHETYLAGARRVRVNMGAPKLSWTDVPLAHEVDTLHLPLVVEPLSDGVGVSMGNPHAIFLVEDVGAVPLRRVGPLIEHDPLFPERVNVTVAQIDSAEAMTLRTWERGAGETLACGTGACASVVAARRRGRVEPVVRTQLPGGSLEIEWRGGETDRDHPVWMTGDVAQSFEGRLPDEAWI